MPSLLLRLLLHAATREQKRKGLLVAPLAEWLRAEAPGLQTFELLAGRLQPSRAPERGCNASVSALAVERLQSFDLSCNLRWIDACLRRLARALNVTALHDSIRDDLRVRPGQADSLRKGTEARLSAVNNATKHELAALDEADAVLFVVDVRAGVTALDREIAQLLHRRARPVIPVANKVDGPSIEPHLNDLYS